MRANSSKMLIVTQVLVRARVLRLEGIGPKMWRAVVCKPTNSFHVQVLYSVKNRNLDKEVLMAELKTKETEASVQAFLKTVTDDQRRKDCLEVMKLLGKITKAEAKMWGSNIIGFGTFRLRYPNGREIDWMQVGLSPRKQNLTLYIRGGLETHEELLQNLGKFKTGKGCLYIKRLEDIDMPALEKLIAASINSFGS
jgi:Domain of unknown function (DU1801)